jgi:hypothetical protein
MTFSGEMNNSVNLKIPEDSFNRFSITDITFNKNKTFFLIAGNIGEIFKISSIRQLIITDYGHVGMFIQEIIHKVTADESCATRDQNVPCPHHPSP